MRLLCLLFLLPAIAFAEPLRIFTGIAPIKTLIEQVGGPLVQVQAMVRPGHNPHTYEPTPRQITELSKAELYVRAGMPFELAWMPRLQAANAQMHILDAYQKSQPDQHTHTLDPHVWTSPLIVKQMAGRIRDKLIELDPAHVLDYRSQYAALAESLDQLHQTIRAQLAPLQGRKFMVFHPAWGHFAATYGLTQIAIEEEGKEPGIRTLANLIQQASQNDIRVIFVQPQFNRRLAGQVARAIDGKLILADPLAADYLDHLRQLANQLVLALNEPSG